MLRRESDRQAVQVVCGDSRTGRDSAAEECLGPATCVQANGKERQWQRHGRCRDPKEREV